MKKRNNIILGLAVFAVALLAVTEFILLPRQQQAEESYRLAQENPITQDIATILPFKNKYMGNASNNMNLFHALPMHEYLNGFEQNPNQLELTVNYNVTTRNSGENDEQKLEQTLIYNSTAVFALIDNMQTLQYRLNDRTYTVTREKVGNSISKTPSSLLSQAEWKANLQDKLQNSGFVEDTFRKITE